MSSHIRKDNVVLPVAVMGTIAVQLPALTATTGAHSTIVAAPGVQSRDALAVFLTDGAVGASSYADIAATSGSTSRLLTMARPSDGSIILGFTMIGGASAYVDLVYTYIAAR